MTTLSTLVTDIMAAVQDPSYTATKVKAIINRKLQWIAGGVLMDGTWLSPPLPELIDSDTVDTGDDAYTSLPDDFQRDLIFCTNSSGRLTVYDSYIKFLKVYPLLTDTGSVSAVAVKGRRLYYQAIPSEAETLTLHFYRYPSTMSDDADEPEGLPSHLAYKLLFHSSCLEIMEFVEDGEGAQARGSKYHEGKFYEAMNELILFVGQDGEPQYIDDDSDYTDDNYWRED